MAKIRGLLLQEKQIGPLEFRKNDIVCIKKRQIKKRKTEKIIKKEKMNKYELVFVLAAEVVKKSGNYVFPDVHKA